MHMHTKASRYGVNHNFFGVFSFTSSFSILNCSRSSSSTKRHTSQLSKQNKANINNTQFTVPTSQYSRSIGIFANKEAQTGIINETLWNSLLSEFYQRIPKESPQNLALVLNSMARLRHPQLLATIIEVSKHHGHTSDEKTSSSLITLLNPVDISNILNACARASLTQGITVDEKNTLKTFSLLMVDELQWKILNATDIDVASCFMALNQLNLLHNANDLLSIVCFGYLLEFSDNHSKLLQSSIYSMETRHAANLCHALSKVLAKPGNELSPSVLNCVRDTFDTFISLFADVTPVTLQACQDRNIRISCADLTLEGCNQVLTAARNAGGLDKLDPVFDRASFWLEKTASKNCSLGTFTSILFSAGAMTFSSQNLTPGCKKLISVIDHTLKSRMLEAVHDLKHSYRTGIMNQMLVGAAWCTLLSNEDSLNWLANEFIPHITKQLLLLGESEESDMNCIQIWLALFESLSFAVVPIGSQQNVDNVLRAGSSIEILNWLSSLISEAVIPFAEDGLLGESKLINAIDACCRISIASAKLYKSNDVKFLSPSIHSKDPKTLLDRIRRDSSKAARFMASKISNSRERNAWMQRRKLLDGEVALVSHLVELPDRTGWSRDCELSATPNDDNGALPGEEDEFSVAEFRDNADDFGTFSKLSKLQEVQVRDELNDQEVVRPANDTSSIHQIDGLKNHSLRKREMKAHNNQGKYIHALETQIDSNDPLRANLGGLALLHPKTWVKPKLKKNSVEKTPQFHPDDPEGLRARTAAEFAQRNRLRLHEEGAHKQEKWASHRHLNSRGTPLQEILEKATLAQKEQKKLRESSKKNAYGMEDDLADGMEFGEVSSGDIKKFDERFKGALGIKLPPQIQKKKK